MENDFEKFDEHKESIDTLFGNNDKSASMSSRERLDDVIESEGADFLEDYGVPEEIGKEVIKKDGGTFMPTHGPTQKLAKEVSRDKLAEGLDNLNQENGYTRANDGRDAFSKSLGNKNYYKNQIDDAKKRKNDSNEKLNKLKDNRDSAKERLSQAKQKNRNIPRNQRTDKDKEDLKKAKNENKEAKKNLKEEKSNIKKAKNDEKNAKLDNLKSKSFMARHPVEAAKMATSNAVKQFAKKIGKKIFLMVAPYLVGAILLFVLVFFVIQLILGPIMEAWGYIDEAITGVADFSEKLTNFYYGFGFQDSKEAFYDELEDLCDKYTCSNDGSGLDVPMILSTLFYTEGMGYDTTFENIENGVDVDKSISGSNTGAFSSIREWLREKYDASKETVDENGLTYNAGKIYRLRKLARNQFYTNAFGLTERRGQEKTVSLTEFIEKYAKNIAGDIGDMLKDFIGITINSIVAPFREIYAYAIGSKYAGSYFENIANQAGDFDDTFKTLISDVFYGLADITDIDISLFGEDGLGVNITYREFAYDEENYKKYLMEYYFENMPEFKNFLNQTSSNLREERKEQLFNDIKSNKKLFESIFLKNVDSSSENYVESCLGAIDQNLVSELNKPVDIGDNTNISFSDNYSYGIVNGKNHNGVDLNETTAGVKLGSNVYAVTNGKIESLEDSKCNDKVCGKSIKISHNVIVNTKEYNFFTIYSNVTPKKDLKNGSNIAKGDTIGTIYNSQDNIEGLHFVFMDANSNKNGVAIDPTNLFIKCTLGGGSFSGSTNEEAVWNYLLGLGYSKNATAGIMGNMSVESASTFDGRIVQGDFDPALTYSINYTNNVDNGSISRNDFSNNGPNGGGYGIVQWTYYTLKEGLYDYAKKERKVSVGDTAMQIDYLERYLQSNNQDLYNVLRGPNVTIDSATRNFMLQFERPADQSESAQSNRVNRAKDIYNRYANK